MAPQSNPYPEGSYRAKAWERARAKERAEAEPPKEAEQDEVEEEIEERKKLGYFRQTTDSNNE